MVLAESRAPDALAAGGTETLVETAWIGAADPAGATPLGQVTAVIAGKSGRIYVADAFADCVYVFDKAGGYIRTMGRRGEGPGEFLNPYGLAWSGEGQLWVFDAYLSRMVVFDTVGIHRADHRRPGIGYGAPWRGRFDGGRLVEMAVLGGERSHLVALDLRDALVVLEDFSNPTKGISPERQLPYYLLRSPTSVKYQTIPYAPRYHWVLDGRGGYWSGWSGEYRLVHRSLKGDTTLIVVRSDVSPVTVVGAEREAAIQDLGWTESVDLSLIPDRKPLFSELAVGEDGELWVFRELVGSAWVADVYSEDGALRTTVKVPYGPTSQVRPYIDRQQLVIATTGALDVPIVVRLERVVAQPGG